MCRSVLQATGQFDSAIVGEIQTLLLIVRPNDIPLQEHKRLKDATHAVGQQGSLASVLGQFPIHGQDIVNEANRVVSLQCTQIEWHGTMNKHAEALQNLDVSQASAVDVFCLAMREHHGAPETHLTSLRNDFAKDETAFHATEFKAASCFDRRMLPHLAECQTVSPGCRPVEIQNSTDAKVSVSTYRSSSWF